jgi:hypothetical protein
MKIYCPSCKNLIYSNEINISTDIAHCAKCNDIFKLSSLVDEDINVDQIPSGSGIITKQTGEYSYKITLPAKKLLVSDIFPFIYCLLWLSFVFYWTYDALLISTFFALFSIPFWIIGILMFAGIFNSMKEEQVIEITSDELKIVKNKPLKSAEHKFSFYDIYTFKPGNFRISNPFVLASHLRYMKSFSLNGLETPLVITKDKTIPFFETANDVEKIWIIKYLNKTLIQKKLVRSINAM